MSLCARSAHVVYNHLIHETRVPDLLYKIISNYILTKQGEGVMITHALPLQNGAQRHQVSSVSL